MAKKTLDQMKLALGRMIGQTKRKDKDVVQLWQDLCVSNNMKTTDRLLELFAWDLNEGGVDLRQYKQVKSHEKVDGAFQEAELAGQISNMATEFANAAIVREKQRAEEMANLYAIINQQQAAAIAQAKQVTQSDSGKKAFAGFSE